MKVNSKEVKSKAMVIVCMGAVGPHTLGSSTRGRCTARDSSGKPVENSMKAPGCMERKKVYAYVSIFPINYNYVFFRFKA